MSATKSTERLFALDRRTKQLPLAVGLGCLALDVSYFSLPNSSPDLSIALVYGGVLATTLGAIGKQYIHLAAVHSARALDAFEQSLADEMERTKFAHDLGFASQVELGPNEDPEE